MFVFSSVRMSAVKETDMDETWMGLHLSSSLFYLMFCAAVCALSKRVDREQCWKQIKSGGASLSLPTKGLHANELQTKSFLDYDSHTLFNAFHSTLESMRTLSALLYVSSLPPSFPPHLLYRSRVPPVFVELPISEPQHLRHNVQPAPHAPPSHA